MLELWQTEWCPASRRVRQRLTELGVDYVARQVPVEQAGRDALRRATASSTMHAVVFEQASTMIAEDAIRIHLDLHVAEPPEAEAYRRKAAKARHRYLEEECK